MSKYGSDVEWNPARSGSDATTDNRWKMDTIAGWMDCKDNGNVCILEATVATLTTLTKIIFLIYKV